MYLGQFDSCQHCCGRTVLTLDANFTDTKKKVWFSGHVSMRTQTEGVVLQTHSQMQSCGAHGDDFYDHRPSSACTIPTKSTSNTDLHSQEHFQYWFTKTPWEWFLTPVVKNFLRLVQGVGPTVHFIHPLQKSWHWPCNVQAIVYICHRYSMAYNQVK